MLVAARHTAEGRLKHASRIRLAGKGDCCTSKPEATSATRITYRKLGTVWKGTQRHHISQRLAKNTKQVPQAHENKIDIYCSLCILHPFFTSSIRLLKDWLGSAEYLQLQSGCCLCSSHEETLFPAVSQTGRCASVAAAF